MHSNIELTTSRRDFLPFGEEITQNVGSRTASLGYGTSDTIRQKFTGYQKDEETALDFAEARMYSNQVGRFTAVDPLLASGKSANPQTFNRYLYISNNPVITTDPSGQCPTGQCPRDWTGSVYTKTITNKDGSSQTFWNNEAPDDSWTQFTGDIVTTSSGADGRSTGEYHITASGWTEITAERLAIRALLNGHQQGLNDIRNGSTQGVKNTGIDLLNLATSTAWAYRNGNVPDTITPNPFAIGRYQPANERQASWSAQWEISLLLAPGVFAAPFSATRALSVVPRAEIHSVYADGTQVLANQVAARLGKPFPSPMADEAQGAHSVLRWDSANGRIYQARTYNSSGQPVVDIDFTRPTFPNGTLRPFHRFGERHPWIPTSGYFKRGSAW